MTEKPCVVYILLADAPIEGHLIKVGMSSEIKRRHGILAAACPFPLEIYQTWRTCTRAASFAIEQTAHEGLAQFNTIGEWFLVPSVDMVSMMLSKLLNEEDIFETRRPLFSKHSLSKFASLGGRAAAEKLTAKQRRKRARAAAKARWAKVKAERERRP